MFANLIGTIREYPLRFCLLLLTASLFIPIAINDLWVIWDAHEGQGFVEMNAAGPENAWSATFESDRTDEAGKAEDERIMEIVDNAGQEVFDRQHWLRGGARLTEGIHDARTVQFWNGRERILDGAGVTLIQNTLKVPRERVIQVMGRDAAWDVAGKVPEVQYLRALSTDEAMCEKVVSLFKVSTGTENFGNAGALMDAPKRDLARYRVKLKRVSLKELRSWKNPYISFMSLFYDGYLSVETFDRGEREAFASTSLYYNDGRVTLPDGTVKYDRGVEDKVLNAVQATMVSALQDAKSARIAAYIEDHVGWNAPATRMAHDKAATKAKVQADLEKNPRYHMLKLQMKMDETRAMTNIIGLNPSVWFGWASLLAFAFFLGVALVILWKLKWDGLLYAVLLAIAGMICVGLQLSQLNWMQMWAYVGMACGAVLGGLILVGLGGGAPGGAPARAAPRAHAPAAHGAH